MASRTQLRLGQVTGSFGDAEGKIVDNLPVAATLAAIPPGSGSLVSTLSQLASAIRQMLAVGRGPLAYRRESRRAIDESMDAEAAASSSLCGWPGLRISATVLAHARPKTTMSRREFAPRRLAPWTDAHADSPAARSPGTMWFGSSPFTVTT